MIMNVKYVYHWWRTNVMYLERKWIYFKTPWIQYTIDVCGKGCCEQCREISEVPSHTWPLLSESLGIYFIIEEGRGLDSHGPHTWHDEAHQQGGLDWARPHGHLSEREEWGTLVQQVASQPSFAAKHLDNRGETGMIELVFSCGLCALLTNG